MFDITAYILAKEFTTATVNKQAGQVITVESTEGHLDDEALNALAESNSSTILYLNKVYRLSRIEGNKRKYINTITNGQSTIIHMTELVIDTDTGDFITRTIMADASPVTELREEFEAHRDDMVRHITAEERDFWNNKVTAEVEQTVGSNYKLKLIKD